LHPEEKKTEKKFGMIEGVFDADFIENCLSIRSRKPELKYLIDGFLEEVNRFSKEVANQRYSETQMITAELADKLGSEGFPALKTYMTALLDNGIEINLQIFYNRALLIGNKLEKAKQNTN
jgi:hypothetical protein